MTSANAAVQGQAASGRRLDLSPAPRLVVQSIHNCCARNKDCPTEYTPFHSVQVPPMSIADYAKRIYKYSGCSDECFPLALILMCRYVVSKGVELTFFNAHRMLITSVMVAAKNRDDEYYSNAYYSSIGGVSAPEVNSLELQLLLGLQWDLFVEPEEYGAWVTACDEGLFYEKLQHERRKHGEKLALQKEALRRESLLNGSVSSSSMSSPPSTLKKVNSSQSNFISESPPEERTTRQLQESAVTEEQAEEEETENMKTPTTNKPTGVWGGTGNQKPSSSGGNPWKANPSILAQPQQVSDHGNTSQKFFEASSLSINSNGGSLESIGGGGGPGTPARTPTKNYFSNKYPNPFQTAKSPTSAENGGGMGFGEVSRQQQQGSGSRGKKLGKKRTKEERDDAPAW